MNMLNNLKAVCPKNPDHKRFGVTAHVTQDWIVDEDGFFEECTCDCTEVTHEPNEEDIWTCAECGAEAIFKPLTDH